MEDAGSGNILRQILLFPKNALYFPFDMIAYIGGWHDLPGRLAYREFVDACISGLFFFFFLRSYGRSAVAGVVGTMFFLFSGYMMVGSTWYHEAFPYVFALFAIEQFMGHRRWYFLPYAFALFSFYDFYFGSILIAIYFLFRLFFNTEELDLKRMFLKGFAVLGLAIVGLGLNYQGFSRAINKVSNNPRGDGLLNTEKVTSGDVSYVEKLSDKPMFGLEEPIHYQTAIGRMFSPDFFGNGSAYRGWYNYLEGPNFYVGILCLALVILSFFTSMSKRQKWAIAGLLMFWFLIVLFPYFRYAFHYFVGDYYKAVLNYFIPFSLALTGFLALKQLEKDAQIKRYAFAVAPIILMILLYYPFRSLAESIDLSMQGYARNMVIVYAIALFALSMPRLKNLALIFLLIVVPVDMIAHEKGSFDKRRTVDAKYFNERKGYNDYTLDAVDYLKAQDEGFYRMEKNYSSAPSIHASMNDAIAQNYFGTQSYGSFNPKYYVRFLQEMDIASKEDETSTRWAIGVKYHPLLHGVFSVKYTLQAPRFQVTPNSLQEMQNAGVPGSIINALWSEGQSMVMDQEDFVTWAQGKVGPNRFNSNSQGILSSCLISRIQYGNFGYQQIHQVQDVVILENQYFVPMGFAYDKIMFLNEFSKLENNSLKMMAMCQALVVENNYENVLGLPELIVDSINPQYTWDDHSVYMSKWNDRSVNWTYTDQHFDHWKGSISLDSPGVLFFSIPNSDWHLEIDGEEVDMKLVNIGFMGAEIEAGEHAIEFYFKRKPA
jgi:hypothetical protein